MHEMTISQVSRRFDVSPRMLRYYEQAGLLKSFRKEDYAYRVYNQENLTRLGQILLLRKLRIPIKHIRVILESPTALEALEIFEENIRQIRGEIQALSVLESILARLVRALEQSVDLPFGHLTSVDPAIWAGVDELPAASTNLKEEKTMSELNQAQQQLSRLTDVRILTLPPATVAAAHYVGDEPEDYLDKLVDGFVREQNLCALKPDLRHYGFNHPNPVDETGYHGYEMWVTIPDDLEVPSPFVKKRFPGGLYAAHMIPMGNFHEWDWLIRWVEKSDEYEFAGDFADQEHMCGLLEEFLNYTGFLAASPANYRTQLDLLAPIRPVTR